MMSPEPGAVPSSRGFSRPLLSDPDLKPAERLYVRCLGVPILGLRIRARYLLPVLAGLRGQPFVRIADAGSGRGLFTVHLARLFPGARVTGMDIDPGQIERNNAVAERLGLDNCRFVFQDVTALEPGGGYDLILSTDNLEHLEDDHRQVRVFYQALAAGGRILFHVPHTTRHVFGWKRTNFMGIEGHVRPGYTRDGLCSMLRDAGFEIEQALYSYTSIETLANDVSYLITGGREKRKALYALAFPLLLLLSQLGRLSRPEPGSGLIVLARKPASK